MSKNKLSTLRLIENSKLVYFIIVAFAFCLYGNSISHSYSLDDNLVTTTDRQQHEQVEKGIGGLLSILRTNYAVNEQQNYDYRPITTYSFAIEWSLFGESENRVHISHFINVLLYSILGIILFVFLNQLLGSGYGFFTFLTTLLFLAHPIHTEVVNSLKNRDELLSLLFALLASIQTFKYIDKKQFSRIIYAILLLLLSILSKKSSMPFLVLIPLTIYFFRSISFKKIGLIVALLFSARILVTLMKSSLIEKSKVREFLYIENPLFEANFWARIPAYFYSNYLYLEKFILPYDLNYYYGFNKIPLIGYFSPLFFISLAIFILLFGLAVWTFKSKSIWSFSILFFLLCIGGACNLLYPMVGIFAERFAFSASIGLSMLCILLLYKVFRLKINEPTKVGKGNQLYLSFGILLLIFSTLTIRRNPDWKNQLSLFQADAKALKTSAKANSLLGQELQYRANKAFSLDPSNFTAFYPTIDSAYRYYEIALKTYPRYEQIYNNEATIKSQYYQDFISARLLFERALQIDASFQDARENLIANEIHYLDLLSRIEIVLSDGNKKEMLQSNELTDSNRKIIHALAHVFNFENIGKIALKKGMSQSGINYLVNFANQLENNNKTLEEIHFSKTISTELFALFSGEKKSGKNILDPIILSLLNKSPLLFSNKTSLLAAKNKSNKYVNNQLLKLYSLNKKNIQYYELASSYHIKNQNYPALIKLQFSVIKNFPESFHAKQYIQIANSFFALKNSKQAQVYFNLGMKELIKERKYINRKTSPTQNDLDRLIQLDVEINKLSNYLNEIKKQTVQEKSGKINN